MSYAGWLDGTKHVNGDKFSGMPELLSEQYDTLFIDSITDAARLCFQWCKKQPENLTRNGQIDNRSAYGMHGQEMVSWLKQFQQIRDKNIIFVGILDEVVDDFKRKSYVMQMDGQKTGKELPGIVDEVITLAHLPIGKDGALHRAFVCQTMNPWGYPAKDRSGRLEVVEEPHLGRLLEKLKSKRKHPLSETLKYDMPTSESVNEAPVQIEKGEAE